MNSEEIITKYNLGKKSWTYKGYHGILHTFYPVQETVLKPFKEFYGDSVTIVTMFIKDDYVSWYWNNEDMDRLRESIIKKVNQDPNFLEYLLVEWHSRLGEFKEEILRCETINLETLSDKELIDLYSDFYHKYIQEYGIAIDLQDSFSMHADKFMKPLLKEILEKQGKVENLEQYYVILTNPINESFILTEYKQRLNILKKIKENNILLELFKKGKAKVISNILSYPELKTMLEEHVEKFFWIQNNYAKMDILGIDHFVDRIMEELDLDPEEKIKEIESHLLSSKEEKEKLIQELNLDKEFQNLIKITEVFAYMQDERKKYVLISNHYQRLFLDEIGKRLNLTRKEMDCTVFPELGNMLMNKEIDKEKLKRRSNGCICIYTLDGYELLDGEIAEEIFNKVFSPKLEGDKIVGSCASKGKASGPVKIIRKTHDLVNFNQGDVLVTSMTRPEMVIAMKKAAAIVTDEGGVTSHAAIVSRELKIPCIIGTQIATKVLKDGDLVEVDANKGLVKILKKE